MKRYLLKTIAILSVGAVFLSACGQNPSSPVSDNNAIQVNSVNAGNITTNQITQTKVFDQCQSSSPLNAQIAFNEIASTETGQQLVLGGSLGGEVGLSAAAKLTVQGSIQQYYSNKQGQSSGHQESISIEIPPKTKQQYNIIWTEYRQQGSVDYSENGQNKSVGYDFRQGVELASSSVTNLDCPGSISQSPTTSVFEPQETATEIQAPIQVPTVAPLFPLSNNGETDGNGLGLTVTIICLANCGNPTFPDYAPLFNVQFKLTNTSQQMIIIPKFGGDESYIALNTGQQLYVWTSIGWCNREKYVDSQSIGPGESIKWEWGYKLKNNECGGTGDMLALPDSSKSFTIVFPAIGERLGSSNWSGTIPR